MERIQALQLARAGAQLRGTVLLAACDRLVAACGRQEGEAHYDLAFGIDEDGINTITGAVSAAVATQCCRCTQELVVQVGVTVRLGLGRDEDACGKLPERYEPVVVPADGLVLSTLIEDEILLALPLAAAHAENECEPPELSSVASLGGLRESGQRRRRVEGK